MILMYHYFWHKVIEKALKLTNWSIGFRNTTTMVMLSDDPLSLANVINFWLTESMLSGTNEKIDLKTWQWQFAHLNI